MATPDIISFKIKNNYDFIVLGCDGIFEKVDNHEICSEVLRAFSNQTKPLVAPAPSQPVLNSTLHSRAGDAIDRTLHCCINNKTLDNVTAVMIGFKNLEELVDKNYRFPGGDKAINLEESYMSDEDLGEENGMSSAMQKLMKPLEAVEEDVEEASETETPVSEMI